MTMQACGDPVQKWVPKDDLGTQLRSQLLQQHTFKHAPAFHAGDMTSLDVFSEAFEAVTHQLVHLFEAG